MQSDQKIGLCLLIALFGFAAALGFGRRPKPAAPVIDAAALAPADELFSLEADELNVPAEKTDRPETVELVAPPSSSEEISKPEVTIPVVQTMESTTPVADPQAAPENVLAQQKLESPVDDSSVVNERHPAFLEYVVKPGDTLSGIAARQLGDGLRYFDVFEANTDLLAHPDALRVGQTIRIPVDRRHHLQTASGDAAAIH